MALMQTKLSKGVLKSKVPRDCAVKAEHSNLSNTSCFQGGWGQGNQDYFSITKILLKQLLRAGFLFGVFGCCYASSVFSLFHVQFFNTCSIVATAWCQRLGFLAKYIRRINDDKDELSKVKGLLSQTG